MTSFAAFLAFALSTKPSPTMILAAFDSYTMLITFFSAEIGKQTSPMSSGHVRLFKNGSAAVMGREIGVDTQCARHRAKKSSFPAQMRKSVVSH